jgi:uncharacterized FAD-dependent dehydrogenase
MIREISLSLKPSEVEDEALLRKKIASASSLPLHSITGYRIMKNSIDARGSSIKLRLLIQVFSGEPFKPRSLRQFNFRNVSKSKHTVLITGAGPAGLFAALRLLEAGIKPIIIERGKDVRARRHDLARLNKEGIINPDSNYCFGEGGAGTYSDGKLYTRSGKRGDINRILELFVLFGANESILSDAHPHIGTNKLPHIITAMRACILSHGGEIRFEETLADLTTDRDKVTSAKTRSGNSIEASAFILATGHSARDIFTLLHQKGLAIESKPFALGVRVEHPQSIINSLQYHDSEETPYLPPASYSLVQQVEGRGVFSFCMCPGGIIAPASTAAGELVVNGWSPSKRNNPYANSGMVVQVSQEDASRLLRKNNIDASEPLLLMHFQEMVEKVAFAAGGGEFVAPAQRLVDFAEGKSSSTLPDCSYIPGVNSCNLREVLPDFIYQSLASAFRSFGKKMKNRHGGFFSNDAIVVATESRTSSPVRIPRDRESLRHPQLSNLYPCGEGAGYAGGIVSAAMDGERVAEAIIKWLTSA